jgi:predicted nuclease of predicted toxin-antitoxin system
VKFKLDENLGSIRVFQMFQDAGHDVMTVKQQEMCSFPDPRVISRASSEERCLVTLDLDFANPLVYKPQKYRGIAVIRQHKGDTPEDVHFSVAALLQELAVRPIDRQLWIVDRGKIRDYRPKDQIFDPKTLKWNKI